MELVDGETLAARLTRGPLSLDQALAIAIEVAEALAAAHAAGVVHRDIKPANIMLTRSGAKLLDFGLARLQDSLVAARPRDVLANDPPTRQSALIGTLPYMAPEQLRGAAVDARTDLFAFGAVLYEMLTGRRAFDAASEAELAAAILEHEPAPLAAGQPLTPPALERLVVTCLAKDPDDRWQTAKDLLRELRWVRDDRAIRTPPAASSEQRPACSSPPRPGDRPVRIRGNRPDAAAGLREPCQLSCLPTRRHEVSARHGGDGRLARRHPPGLRRALRRWQQPALAAAVRVAESRPIDGSDGAHNPFWAPDGRSIAFFAHNRLKRIAEAGGSPQDICAIGFGEGSGTWSREGVILFGAFGQALFRVAETGGVPTPATALDPSRQQYRHSWPAFLPDGRRFLFLAHEQRSGRDGGVSGNPGVDRNTAGVRRGFPCRGRRHARADPQQGVADRPAVRRGPGAGRRP